MAGPADEVDMQVLRDLLRGWETLADDPKRMMLETIVDYADVLPKGPGKRLDIHSSPRLWSQPGQQPSLAAHVLRAVLSGALAGGLHSGTGAPDSGADRLATAW